MGVLPVNLKPHIPDHTSITRQVHKSFMAIKVIDWQVKDWVRIG